MYSCGLDLCMRIWLKIVIITVHSSVQGKVITVTSNIKIINCEIKVVEL